MRHTVKKDIVVSVQNLRYPAVPLITHDPFFSVWSFATNLTDDTTRHWSGTRQFITGVAAVDGIYWEFLGKLHAVNSRYATGYRKMKQLSCEVRALTTEYLFETPEIQLKLSFTSPLLPSDLYMVSRPVSYIDYNIFSHDGREHDVKLYWGFSAEFCVNLTNQEVTYGLDDLSAWFSSGTEKMLKNSGDDHRIEWGSFHVSAPGRHYRAMSLRAFQKAVQEDFHSKVYPYNYADNHGPIRECLGPEKIEPGEKNSVSPFYPAITVTESFRLKEQYRNFIAISYDDIKCIDYFGKKLEAYWRKTGESFNEMLHKAIQDHDEVMERVRIFDEKLKDIASVISEKYYNILALSFRQVIAGHKLTSDGNEILFFSKENYSNGCIGTVDITYPSLPFFLYFNTTLAKGMLNPIFHMIDIGKWKYDFAPHDVGTYPLAEGQVYGFTERFLKRNPDPMSFQMPAEESGNMLLCVTAICTAEKDCSYFNSNYNILKKWADYLVKAGPDHENQLCTDDFAGHLSHNCNLSVKSICALGAFASMLRLSGRTEESDFYSRIAHRYAGYWEKNAFAGDHYKLTFDNPSSWSLKYNIVWDRLLNLNLFSNKVYKTEISYYKTKFNRYGLPLDNRSDCTKTDWQMWTAAMTDDTEYRNMVIDAMWDFLNETEDRIPFSDLVFTSRPVSRGFQARTVQGGLFICLLSPC